MSALEPATLVEIAVRTAIVYVALIALIRLAGKREVGQLTILELVTLLLIADAVQGSMVGADDTLLGGLVAAATLILLDRLLGVARQHVPGFRKAVEGEPRILVRDGRQLPRAMREEGVTTEDLETAIREHGVRSVEEVDLAVLETDGKISVIPKGGRPPTPAAAVNGPKTV